MFWLFRSNIYSLFSIFFKSILKNAQAYLDIEQSGINFAEFIWQFVDGKPIRNSWKSDKEVPVSTPESDAMAKALKKRGFSFVGTTICYAFMQAVGMVNDHTVDCHCYDEINRLSDNNN